MSGAHGLGALLIGAALLIHLFAQRPLAGLAPGDAALAALFLGAVLFLTGWALDGFRRHWTQGIWGLVVAGLVATGIVSVYLRRGDVEVALDAWIGEIAQGKAVVTQAGEVVVARRMDGSFTLSGQVNARDQRFIFDTGASTVVLTAESAAQAGLDAAALAFVVPVSTANGRTLAAPAVLESLQVGSIVERRVQALVAQPGVLHENLLGMTFLNRLASYEVRGNRLILRPKAIAGR